MKTMRLAADKGVLMHLRVTGFAVLVMAASAAFAESSPLADAAEHQNWSTVQTLVNEGGDINAAQADGTTALLWAAHHDNTAMVVLLLDRGADANVKNRYGITPLAEAALNGNAANVERLLNAGADVNGALSEGDTPLMLASRAGNADAVRALLAKGAKVDARDNWHGETALMWAAGENHADVVRLLVKAGADVNAKAIAFDWQGIKHGGVQSQLPAGGLTPLLQAARQNSIDAAVALLEAGADANLKDPLGVSPLRVAISNGHLDLARELVERGADINEGSLVEAVKFRTTPMMRAANNRPNQTTDLELIHLLFTYGATADSVAKVGLPKKDAFEAGSPGGVAPSETALYLAANAQDIELMKLLLERGGNANHATDKGATPLMAAVGRTYKRPAMNGAPPIVLRPATQRIEAAQLLLDHGAKINAADATGITALHAMAGQGENEMVQYLAGQGAKLDLRDSSNRTPLDVAKAVQPIPVPGTFVSSDPRDAQQPQPETVALLRGLMADANVREVAYVAPAPVKATPAAAPAKVADAAVAGPKKAVTAIIAPQN